MKNKLVLLVFCLFFLLSASQNSQSYVYVCLSSKAYAYHIDRNCRFLNQCKQKIKRVTLKDAIELGRKPCKGCTK